MKEKLLDNCSLVKTMLMISVMVYHSCVFWAGNWLDVKPVLYSESLGYFAYWLNSFHIYAFTLVSGYIFAFKIRGGGYSTFGILLKTKAKRLLIPYFFVAAIWFTPVSVIMFKWDLSMLVRAYLFCESPEQLWFLWMLFDIFVFIWPVRKYMIKNPFIGWCLSCMFWFFGLLGYRTLPNNFCIWTACQYIPFFYLGMRIRIKEEKGEKGITELIPWYLWIIADGFLFASTLLIRNMDGFMWSVVRIMVSLFLHIVGAVMAWTTLQAIASRLHWKNCNFIKILSQYSMPMYLFHQQIIYFTIYWLNGKVNPWFNSCINFFTAFVGSFLISAVLMKWKVTRVLIGEK